jgi:hypothetical protein
MSRVRRYAPPVMKRCNVPEATRHKVMLFISKWLHKKHCCQTVRNMGYSQQEHVFILERYFDSKSFIAVREAFHHVYPDKSGPNKTTVQRLGKKCSETGSVCVKKHVRRRTVLTNDAVHVHGTLLRRPMESLRRLLVAARRSNTPHCKHNKFLAEIFWRVHYWGWPVAPMIPRPHTAWFFFCGGVSKTECTAIVHEAWRNLNTTLKWLWPP